MWPFSRKARRRLGIDIGTSSVKVVELERDGVLVNLANYGFLDGMDFFGDLPTNPNSPSSLKISESEAARILKQIMVTAKTKAKDAVFSIPIFSSFLTVIELPQLSQKELESSVPFEARAYIPVPLSEVVLDWLVIPKPNMPANLPNPNPQVPVSVQPKKVDVLLIAVPKEVVSKYQRIAAAAGLNLAGLESESFSLARALAGNDLGIIMLADFGARSTNLTIIDRGYIYMSHTAEVSGKELTKMVSSGLGVAPQRAEELKRSAGIASVGLEKGLAQVIAPLIDKLVVEIQRMNDSFLKKENRRVEKIILTGGSANLPGLNEYLSRHLGLEVVTGNPFSKIKFDTILEPIFRRDLSSQLAVAAGLALRED